MKLTAKYTRATLMISVIVLVAAGLIYYIAISLIFTDQIDHLLTSEEREIFDYVRLRHQLPDVFETNTQRTVLTPIKNLTIKRRFTDTPFFNKNTKDYESGRALISSITVNHQNYRILILDSKVETQELIQTVFLITICLITIFIGVLTLTSKKVLNRLWQPFYDNLSRIQLYTLRDSHEIPIIPTEIDEFRDLNVAVNQMSLKAKTDYDDLKAFTENASHELLTPLAIINSKLDTLIQSTDLSEKQSKLVSDLYSTVCRLTRLNKSLLLLVKVENKLIKEDELVDLKLLVQKMVDQFEELFRDKELQVTCRLANKEVYASYYLMEILINNLLSNAIRHNYNGGRIYIKLTSAQLVVQNSGSTEALNTEEVFKRFNKSSESEGSGLGLTICQQICHNMGFAFTYDFTATLHSFNVEFN